MIKTQVQIPDDLFAQAKAVAAAKEWSFAEIVRRGLEQMVARQVRLGSPPIMDSDWRLPEPVHLGMLTDPFLDPDWREEANLSSGAARLLASRLRDQAARYEEGA